MNWITPAQLAERRRALIKATAKPKKIRVCKRCGRNEEQTEFLPKARRCTQCLIERRSEESKRYVQNRNIRRRETGRR